METLKAAPASGIPQSRSKRLPKLGQKCLFPPKGRELQVTELALRSPSDVSSTENRKQRSPHLSQ